MRRCFIAGSKCDALRRGKKKASLRKLCSADPDCECSDSPDASSESRAACGSCKAAASSSERRVFDTCRDHGWGTSPSAYVGGMEIPPALWGSSGPASACLWDPSASKCSAPLETSAEELAGLPGGTTAIRWLPDAPGKGQTTVECCTGWGCLPSEAPGTQRGWQTGRIFNYDGQVNVDFAHVWERDLGGARKLRIWESKCVDGANVEACQVQLEAALRGEPAGAAINCEGGCIHYMEAGPLPGGRGVPRVEDPSRWSCDAVPPTAPLKYRTVNDVGPLLG